jgi:branched-subunit amino acid aminotransferase/4-amino-4-deoxychorismate lyase
LVIEWASNQFEVIECEISQEEFLAADEVFITSTTRDVSPVSKIATLDNSSRINNVRTIQVGPITQEIAKIFKAKSEQMSNP